MIACVDMKNGYPTTAVRGPFGALGLDPVTAAAVAPAVADILKNASGQGANAEFFSFARGSALLGEQTRMTGIVTAGLVVAGVVLGGVILWKVLK